MAIIRPSPTETLRYAQRQVHVNRRKITSDDGKVVQPVVTIDKGSIVLSILCFVKTAFSAGTTLDVGYEYNLTEADGKTITLPTGTARTDDDAYATDIDITSTGVKTDDQVENDFRDAFAVDYNTTITTKLVNTGNITAGEAHLIVQFVPDFDDKFIAEWEGVRF